MRHVIGPPGLPQSSAAESGTPLPRGDRARSQGAPPGRGGERGLHAGLGGRWRAWTADRSGEGPSTSTRSRSTSISRLPGNRNHSLIEERSPCGWTTSCSTALIDRVHRLPDGDVEIVDYMTYRQGPRHGAAGAGGIAICKFMRWPVRRHSRRSSTGADAGGHVLRAYRADRVETDTFRLPISWLSHGPKSSSRAREHARRWPRRAPRVGEHLPPVRHSASTCRHAIRGDTPNTST